MAAGRGRFRRSMGTLRRLIGVYHAKGSLSGELAYWVGARLGRAHCALCDITHGVLREKASWRACTAELPVVFETFHLDDQPAELAAVTAGRTPCVVAETGHGLDLLLDPADLESCGGDPQRFVQALTAAIERRGLRPESEVG
jgi:hypothetical protein